MNQGILKFTVKPGVNISHLEFATRFNGQTFFDQTVDQQYIVEHTFEDVDNGQGVLEFELKNKSTDHTKIDENGNIVADSTVEIHNIEIAGINIDQLIYNNSTYTHDFNGTQPLQTVKFYGIMGCNGVVRFEFTTPFYLWLLENL
jgi:hypothetical protein